MAERYTRDTVVVTTAEINELSTNKALDPTVEYWVDRNRFAYAPDRETIKYLVSGDGNSGSGLPTNLSDAFYRDAAAIAASPPDLEFDFTTAQALPTGFNCTTPGLSDKGLYISNATSACSLALATLLPALTFAAFTVEVEFETDGFRSGNRTIFDLGNSGVNYSLLRTGGSALSNGFANVNVAANVTVATGATTTFATGRTQRALLAAASGTGAIAADGILLATPAMTAPSGQPSLYLGGRVTNADYLFGWIKRVRIWVSRTPDARITARYFDLPVVFPGDSLTQGTGASTTANAYPYLISRDNNITVNNLGISGETSTQIATRFLAANKIFRDCTEVIWVGRNNPNTAATVIADIESIRKSLTHKRFVVLSVINSATETAGSGSTYTNIIALNAALAAQYPDNYIDVRTALVTASGGANDAINASWTLDNLHLLDVGYTLVSQLVSAFLKAKKWI